MYAYATRSDSFEYFDKAVASETWGELWGTGTTFIRWLAWPFAHALGLSFPSLMVIFSWMGFTACGYWYLAIKENLMAMPPVWRNLAWTEIILLLPNIHFWSVSLGKGAVIFMGIGMFVYGLSRFNRRLPLMIGGILIAYLVRPHMAMVMMMGTGLGIVLAGKAVPWYMRILLTLIAGGLSAYLFQGAVEFTGVEEGNVDSFLSHRTAELGKADSGVDISNYNIFMKLFTFWFRPLFVDAPGAFGFIVSFENALCIYLLYVIVVQGLRSFPEWNGWYRSCLFIFLLGSIILAQVSGNLGIAMRQKAQIMPLFFIIFLRVKQWQYERAGLSNVSQAVQPG